MTDLFAPHGALSFFLDLQPDLGDFRDDLITGLNKSQKMISPKYFYDETGSLLFNQITELDEYYPTRTEKKIILENAPSILDTIDASAAILEYGSGSVEKVEWLTKGLPASAYVAMDISRDHLLKSASKFAAQFDGPVAAICADFHTSVSMPKNLIDADHWVGYFPGSTIGNMTPENAIAFLSRCNETLGPDASFLLGVDLEKDVNVLEAAYDDAKGVTARFNLNLLTRMKQDLGAKLRQEDFEHYAFYNQSLCRIEMHLRAIRETEIVLDDHQFRFAAGETLHTENSHKYSINHIKSLLSETPWRLDTFWTDKQEWYAMCLLRNN